MQFSTLLVALVAPLAFALPSTEAPETHMIEKRDCFNDNGENWGSEYNFAVDLANRFCNEVQGNFRVGEVKYRCYNLNNKKKVDFSLKYKGLNTFRTIKQAECFNGIHKEIHGCKHGGRTSYANWEYTADPNAAQCAKN
ncbi:hypothetical protein V8F20_008089 [Naviculisporaceae sp. PSN 640]